MNGTKARGFVKELECIVCECIDCGCLVAGANRCGRCVKDLNDNRVAKTVGSVLNALNLEIPPYTHKSANILASIIKTNLELNVRSDLANYNYNKTQWLKECCTIRLNMGRGWGHTSAALTVLPNIFNSVLFLHPSEYMLRRFSNLCVGCHRTMQNIFGDRATRGQDLSMYDCIVIDNASYQDLELEKIYCHLVRYNLSQNFTLLLLG